MKWQIDPQEKVEIEQALAAGPQQVLCAQERIAAQLKKTHVKDLWELSGLGLQPFGSIFKNCLLSLLQGAEDVVEIELIFDSFSVGRACVITERGLGKSCGFPTRCGYAGICLDRILKQKQDEQVARLLQKYFLFSLCGQIEAAAAAAGSPYPIRLKLDREGPGILAAGERQTAGAGQWGRSSHG